MMETRARTSRRNKVTVRWLPFELIIEVFRRVQKSIEFSQAAQSSITLNQEYNDNLLAFALSSREWTAIAQAELFRHVILKNRNKTIGFLDALRGSEKLRGFSHAVTSLNFGSQYAYYKTEGLGDDLDEIALYCPNVVEVSTLYVDVRLEYFRMLLQSHLAQREVLTTLFARRKYEEVGQAHHHIWIHPPAFDLQSTNRAFHSAHVAALPLQR
jgi:hypothetical protein